MAVDATDLPPQEVGEKPLFSKLIVFLHFLLLFIKLKVQKINSICLGMNDRCGRVGVPAPRQSLRLLLSLK